MESRTPVSNSDAVPDIALSGVSTYANMQLQGATYMYIVIAEIEQSVQSSKTAGTPDSHTVRAAYAEM